MTFFFAQWLVGTLGKWLILNWTAELAALRCVLASSGGPTPKSSSYSKTINKVEQA